MLSQLLAVIITFIILSLGLCSDIKDCISSATDLYCIVEDTSGNMVLAKDIDKRFNPASTLKILTSLVALNKLGSDYRFKTEFYLSKDNNLKIKGYGDPFLISEVLNEIAKNIAKRVSAVKDIIIDDSYFTKIKIPGVGTSLNPYDAPVGAFCVNFNTIYVRVYKNKFFSAEPQTPLIPFALRLLKKMGIKESGRYTLCHDPKIAEIYAGRLFLYFLKRYGVKVSGDVMIGKVRQTDVLIETYYSTYTLKEIIKEMMKYSNNFIANQILLVLGAELYGPPATLDKGIKAIKEYAGNQLGIKDIEIVEGSGISKEDLISCRDMGIILKKFRPYMELLPRNRNVYYKTGTLKGISTRAGYIVTPNHTYIFMLFLKGDSIQADNILNCIVSTISPKGIP